MDRLSNESIFIIGFDQVWEKFTFKFQNLAYKKDFLPTPLELLRSVRLKENGLSVTNFLFKECRRFQNEYHFEGVEEQSK